ncbi:MAG: hypothetical protein GWO16_02670 [Gammaproteobacteria bacterium]|nr:hypothetical protein [Gammaproteobacteria bacterium]NIR28570.1 hypothetical protein [Gammaproteobacteria bacterium]NIR97040.1 hypothetical protein [Gammaproteobacteria bacterium]NIT62738.1 hypothetical protein [Gammaproteobacteria bacterium]NIV19696.1 hypothetical protein [Gammaproteobacteria bacterium]
MNERRCVFEKALLTRRFGCQKLTTTNIGEREAVGCSDGSAQQQCRRLLEHMRRNAAFVLKRTGMPGPFPHAHEIRVQCGGLLGLKQLICGESESDSLADIHALVRRTAAEYEDLDALPYRTLVRSIARYQGRRPRRRRP